MNNNKVSAFSVFKAKEKIGFDIGLDSPSSKALNTPSKNGDMKSSNVKKKLKRNKNEPLSSLRNSIRKKVKKDAHHEISLKPAENKRKPSVLQVFERNWAENITDLNSSSLEREFLPQVLEQKKVQNDLHKIGYQEKSNSVVDLTAKKSEKKKSVRLKNQSSKASSAAINQEKNDITNEHSKNQIKNLSSLSGKELFNWVLAPISSERFFSEAWQKKPLFIKRRQPLYNTNWFSTKKLDKILREKNVQYTKNLDIAVYRNGQRETLNPEGRAFPSVVWKFYEDGCSIRLLNPQIFAKSVHQLTSRLQEYFGCLVGSNVYLTPPGSQGFAPHYDDIEAFVIQLEGKKHWKLYPPRNSNEVLARYSSENMQEENLGEPILNKVLEAGDTLYFPRGVIHQASTLEDSHSLHITISLYQKSSWGDYLEKLIPLALQKAISENVMFREGLPIDFSSFVGVSNSEKKCPERDTFVKTVKKLMEKLIDYVEIDEAGDELVLDHMEEFQPPYYSSDDVECTVFSKDGFWDGEVRRHHKIELSTELRLVRPGIIRVIPADTELQVYYSVENSRQYKEVPLRVLRFSLEDADLLEYFLLSYPAYVVVENAPGDDIHKVDVAKRLYNFGILRSKVPLVHT